MLFIKHCRLGKFYKYFIHFTKISTVVITVLFTLQYQNIQAQLYVAKGTELHNPSSNITVADAQDTIHISKIYVVEGIIISGLQQNKLAKKKKKNDEIEKPKFTYQEQSENHKEDKKISQTKKDITFEFKFHKNESQNCILTANNKNNAVSPSTKNQIKPTAVLSKKKNEYKNRNIHFNQNIGAQPIFFEPFYFLADNGIRPPPNNNTNTIYI